MECEECVENGRDCVKSWREASWARIYEHELGSVGAGDLQLDFAAAVPRATSRRQMYPSVVPIDRQNHTNTTVHVPTELPFMSTMDEITYWIYTKRAPCLMNYDNVLKKQTEEANCSSAKPKSVHGVAQQVHSPKKKKKRKLLIHDDVSASTEKQGNLYFDVSHKQNRKTIINSCKSDSIGSDIDFNIKKSSIQGKAKRSKLQKNSRTTVHKKNKIVTSTPKVTSLRRSLRQAQQTLNNGNISSSFVFNSSDIIGNKLKNTIEQKPPDNTKKSAEILAGGDHNHDDKHTITNGKPKNILLNGQFEDLSDVSGFTANYIRSTKVQSSKTPRKLRCKNTRNLLKVSRQSLPKDSTTLVCINKAMNTDLPKDKTLNCSTDSSQNIVNLVTVKNNVKPTKVNKSTSQLKFMDPSNKSKESINDKRNGNNNLNISFQSSTSRYPKRHKNTDVPIVNNGNQSNKNIKKINKNFNHPNNSDRKEGPEENIVSRTRSGRSIGLVMQSTENSVLVVSNSTEQVSSMASINVASPGTRSKLKKKRKTNRIVHTRRSGPSVYRDSLRNKSGFAACFSDSDDSEPLQRKFFCV